MKEWPGQTTESTGMQSLEKKVNSETSAHWKLKKRKGNNLLLAEDRFIHRFVLELDLERLPKLGHMLNFLIHYGKNDA